MLSSYKRIAKASLNIRPRRQNHWFPKLPTATVAALLEHGASDIGSSRDVTVTGFVRSVRKQKNHVFVAIGDGSSYESLQVVAHPHHAQG